MGSGLIQSRTQQETSPKRPLSVSYTSTTMAEEEVWTPAEYVINGLKVRWGHNLSRSNYFFALSYLPTYFFSLHASLPNQLLFAISPLLVLGYVLISAFEPEEVENKKRNKKSDFNLEGHGE